VTGHRVGHRPARVRALNAAEVGLAVLALVKVVALVVVGGVLLG
jgi:hypothetical protein